MSIEALSLALLKYKPMALVFMALVGWPLVSAILNVLIRRKSPEEWEKWALQKPKLAFVIEVLRAMGVDPQKALIAAQRYANRKSGQVPSDLKGLPPSVAGLLSDPQKLELLEKAAQKIAAAGAADESPATPEPPKA